MNLKLYILLFSAILLLASLFRFYKLGEVPHGMTWDEAAIGYNGSAIWKTRRDEWLVRLPTSFRSFGDYKAPLAIYVNGLFTAVFGMNLWAVRLPFTIASVVGIAGFMLLTKELFDLFDSKDRSYQLSLFAGSLMALSPWHIHYSRAAFESGMALTLIVWGLWLTSVSYKAKRTWVRSLVAAGGLSSMVLSIYTYHSAKIVAPLLTVLFVVLYFKKLWRDKIALAFAIGLGLSLLYPFAKDVLYGQSLQRIDSSILNDLSGSALAQTIGINLVKHLSPNFLVLGATTTLRHGGGWGVLLPSTFSILVVGIGLFFYSHLKRSTEGSFQKLFLLGFAWALIGLIPAAIGEEIPHSNRALLALPGFLIVAVVSAKQFLSVISDSKLNRSVEGTHHESGQVVKAVLGLLILLHCLYSVRFLHYYFGEFARNSADAFKDGYVEAFTYVKPFEDSVDKILFSSDYGQPYIYALFVRKTNPIWYQGGSLIKYEFTEKITAGDLDRKNTVVVASSTDETPIEAADHVVYGSDGVVRFKIYTP